MTVVRMTVVRLTVSAAAHELYRWIVQLGDIYSGSTGQVTTQGIQEYYIALSLYRSIRRIIQQGRPFHVNTIRTEQ